MRRGVPVALVVGLALRLVVLAALVTQRFGVFGTTLHATNLVLDLRAPAYLAVAVGAWLLRRGAPPLHRNALAIASVLAWAAFAIALSPDLLEELHRRAWIRSWLDLKPHADALVLGGFGVALAVGAERSRIVAVLASLAAVAASVLVISGIGSELGVAGVAGIVALALQGIVAVRAGAQGTRDAARGAAGLHRTATGLWWFALLSLGQIGALVLVGLVERSLRGYDGYLYIAVYAMHLAPLVLAAFGALAAADARVGMTWLVAVAAPLLVVPIPTFLAAETWWLVALLCAIPLALGVALWWIGRATAPVVVALALLLGSVVAVRIAIIDARDKNLWFLAIAGAVALAHAAGWYLLSRVARDAAKNLERDPTALDRVFA